jgi:hypothetical protein
MDQADRGEWREPGNARRITREGGGMTLGEIESLVTEVDAARKPCPGCDSRHDVHCATCGRALRCLPAYADPASTVTIEEVMELQAILGGVISIRGALREINRLRSRVTELEAQGGAA